MSFQFWPLYSYDRRDVEHCFEYCITNAGNVRPSEWTFHVVTSPGDLTHDKWHYELSLKRNGAGIIQSMLMENHAEPKYEHRRIGVALLQEVSRVLGEDVVSSPTYKDMSERRGPGATRVWELLVQDGLAVPEGEQLRLLHREAVKRPNRRL